MGGSRDHRFTLAAGRQGLGEGLTTGSVAPQEGNRKAPVGIEDNDGWVVGFVLELRADQSGDGAAGPDGHKGTTRAPVGLQQGLQLSLAPMTSVGRAGQTVDVT